MIGAGIGGLVAAIDLARQGMAVTVLERAASPGGKLRQASVGGVGIDAGPTVFTMRAVFEEIFADAGASLSDHLALLPVSVLARHAWAGDQTLDLFADIDRSVDAIGRFAGAAEARGYRDFCARARGVFRTLERPFIRAGQPSALSLVRDAGLRGLPELWRIAPFATLWQALGTHFRDPRLRQLFGRYATYAGSSPFLAPATLMLIAHVEQDGVWLVQGGMVRLADALVRLAERLGVQIRGEAGVARIGVAGGRVEGVVLDSGEVLPAGQVVVNADAAAIATGRLGAEVARGVRLSPGTRSLSAVTWALHARASGFALDRHNVFFSPDYAAEFASLSAGRLPDIPTIYVCAQDRGAGAPPPDGPERLLVLVNAPATGDTAPLTPQEIAQCTDRSFDHLARLGLRIDLDPARMQTTTPTQFAAMFPATGGALYGQAVHGPMAAFHRPGPRGRIAGLYLAGGSTHPGAGVPMAALSGRLAARCLLADLARPGRASTRRSGGMAMSGGMSTR